MVTRSRSSPTVQAITVSRWLIVLLLCLCFYTFRKIRPTTNPIVDTPRFFLFDDLGRVTYRHISGIDIFFVAYRKNSLTSF